MPLRIFFPSLDGSVETAPLLEGCGRYPLILFAHGHCQGDVDHFRRWFRIPAQLARAGYVVIVPLLAGNAGGSNPSVSSHPDEGTLHAVLTWARSGWEHSNVLMPPPATGVVGHSFGAMLGARFALGRQIDAYAGMSGGWQDWFGDEPFPLTRLQIPTLLMWGLGFDSFSPLPNATWEQMVRPRHRVVFAKGEHWDYLGPVNIPCSPGQGPCAPLHSAAADLLTMFFGRYLPPELASDLPGRIPSSLEPPVLNLPFEQAFFAGGYLGGYAAMSGDPNCGVTVTTKVESLVANKRSRETHSLNSPCAFVSKMSARNRLEVTARPAGFKWCDFCFRARADG